MNWIKKTLRFGEKIKRIIRQRPSKDEIANSDWTSCCKGPILKKDLEDNLMVCPSCNKHHRINPRQRFDIIFGKNNYEVLTTPIPQDDPLKWNDSKPYTERLKAARKKTGMNCGIMVVKTNIKNINLTAIASDFNFIGGSIGAAEGEAFLYGIQNAIENQQPFVVFTSGGGMRMMESLISLSQMTRTTLAINELKKNNLPYIVVLTDPTTGGVTASWAMLGDILIAEPKATIGFAGRRVIQDTVRETLPDQFQTAEYVKDHGGIDLVVERQHLNSTIGTLLNVLLKKAEAQAKQESNVTVDKSLQAAS